MKLTVTIRDNVALYITTQNAFPQSPCTECLQEQLEYFNIKPERQELIGSTSKRLQLTLPPRTAILLVTLLSG